MLATERGPLLLLQVFVVSCCFRLGQADLISGLTSGVTTVAPDAVNILTANNSSALIAAVNDIIAGVPNAATAIELSGAINPSCNNILIQNVCPNVNVTFWLYTNTTNAYQLKEDDITNLQNAPFIPNVEVAVIIHGFTGNKSYTPNPQIRPEFIAMGYNVISVDYGPAALSPCYFQSVRNSPIVANCTARALVALLQNTNVTLGSLQVVGLSLGTQIAGLVGSLMILAGYTLKFIAALDAAAPLFELYSFISPASAKFVEGVHTTKGTAGKLLPIGNIDFYVDIIGISQPTCNGDIKCSHEISSNYYGESINSSINPTKGFYGIPFPCLLCTKDNQVIMGPYTPPGNYSPGIYCVTTNTQAPFGAGKPC